MTGNKGDSSLSFLIFEILRFSNIKTEIFLLKMTNQKGNKGDSSFFFFYIRNFALFQNKKGNT